MNPSGAKKFIPVMTIAGSDNSGGAGIQADLKTFQAFGCYGLSAIAAITAQSSLKFKSYEAVSSRMLSDQIEASIEQCKPLALKTGMLATAENIEAVAKAVQKYDLKNLVIDPVLKASAGSNLTSDDYLNALKEILIPMAYVITPNKMEAELLSGLKINSYDDIPRAAKIIQNMGVQNVIIKGGHLDFDKEECIDTLFTASLSKIYSAKKISNASFHGTGCTFSAAICAGLGLGFDIEKGVGYAKEYVWQAMNNTLEGTPKGLLLL